MVSYTQKTIHKKELETVFDVVCFVCDALGSMIINVRHVVLNGRRKQQ